LTFIIAARNDDKKQINPKRFTKKQSNPYRSTHDGTPNEDALMPKVSGLHFRKDIIGRVEWMAAWDGGVRRVGLEKLHVDGVY
jgi:hypothetical protein